MPLVRFNGSPSPTLGVEVELQLIDRESRDHAQVASDVLSTLGHPITIKHELFESTIEINTGICKTAADARSDLQEALDRLFSVCDDNGWDLMSSGTHPFADWRKQVVSPHPRYQDLVDRIQLPARRLAIFGIHFHVGVAGPETAIAVQNALVTYLPHLLALSASSPYWQGADSGLASSRASIFEVMPTAGLPYRMDNWSEFVRYMAALQASRAIETVREIWTDIRPHPDFGTLEIRICDGAPTLTEIAALAALTQCTVVWLTRLYDSGRALPILSPWIVRENKWRAARFGLDADLITGSDGSLKPLLTSVRELCGELVPIATELGCTKELDDIETIVAHGPSYRRQRAVFESTNSLRAVVDALVRELRTDAIVGAP